MAGTDEPTINRNTDNGRGFRLNNRNIKRQRDDELQAVSASYEKRIRDMTEDHARILNEMRERLTRQTANVRDHLNEGIDRRDKEILDLTAALNARGVESSAGSGIDPAVRPTRDEPEMVSWRRTRTPLKRIAPEDLATVRDLGADVNFNTGEASVPPGQSLERFHDHLQAGMQVFRPRTPVDQRSREKITGTFDTNVHFHDRNDAKQLGAGWHAPVNACDLPPSEWSIDYDSLDME